MIYIRIVYYQETIVALLIGFHLYSWVLAIVLLNIQFQLMADSMCIDGCCHSSITFTQHQQYRIIHIIVNKKNGFLRCAYQVSSKLISIKNLPVVENSFDWRKRSANEEVDFLRVFSNFLL